MINDDAASQPHEALFAATATHQTLRKMQLREVATQRSHVVMLGGGRPSRYEGASRPLQHGAAGAAADALRSDARGGSPQERPARPRGDRRLGVGRAPLAETLRALPEELEGLSMHPNLREQRRSELDTGGAGGRRRDPRAAQPCGAQRAFAAASNVCKAVTTVARRPECGLP